MLRNSALFVCRNHVDVNRGGSESGSYWGC